jgi:hypothetical protein
MISAPGAGTTACLRFPEAAFATPNEVNLVRIEAT